MLEPAGPWALGAGLLVLDCVLVLSAVLVLACTVVLVGGTGPFVGGTVVGDDPFFSGFPTVVVVLTVVLLVAAPVLLFEAEELVFGTVADLVVFGLVVIGLDALLVGADNLELCVTTAAEVEGPFVVDNILLELFFSTV